MIRAADLIAKFQFALDNHWGYIWGKWGQVWTARDQANASREMTVKYGSKWIGHHVADCSGLFRWAFDQLGGTISHGSNLIYDGHCRSKGKLSGGRRTDGQELLPGTAVFTGTDSSKPHIGLYVGNGTVIEASGSKVGVITTDIGNSKWKYW